MMRSTIFLLLLCLALAVPAHAAMDVTFQGNGVHVSGMTKRGTVALLSVMWEADHGLYTLLNEESTLLTDNDGDGIVDFDLKRAIPIRSLWAVVDVDSGDYRIATVGDYPRRELAAPDGFVRGTATDEFDDIVGSRFVLRVLWVSPHHGAWVLRTADGGAGDADGKNNGHTVSSTSAFAALVAGEKPPKKMKTDDVLIAIDPFEMAFFAVKVTK